MSGRQVGSVIGAVIGSFFGPIGSIVGSFIGGEIGNAISPSGAPQIGDLRPQSSEYGRPIPIIFGSAGVPGNVIWASEYTIVEDEGGFFDAPGAPTVFANFAVLVCESPNGDKTLGRIWAGPEKRLVWDGTLLEGENDAEIIWYNGAADQLPDPTMESYLGVGNVSAHRGYAVLLVKNFSLVHDGNRIPFLTVELGKTTTQENTGPASIGTAWFSRVIQTATRMYAFYYGTYYGTIIRELSTDVSDPQVAVAPALVAHFSYDVVDEAGEIQGTFFVDEDRGRLVSWRAGLSYNVTTISNGVRLNHEISAPVGGDADPGDTFFGGCYLNGDYIFASRGASVTDRVGLWVVDPDTHTCTALYCANSGSGAAGTIMRPPPGTTGSYVYVLSAGAVTKHHLASATTADNLGVSNGTQMEVDQSAAGYIWTVRLTTAGTNQLTVTVHHPASGGALFTYGPASTYFWSLAPQAISFMSNDTVVIAGEAWLALDYFHVFPRSSPFGTGFGQTGGYHGINTIQALVQNTVAGQLWALRRNGIVTTSVVNWLQWGPNYPGDWRLPIYEFGDENNLSSIKLLRPPSLSVQEGDSWYIAAPDENAGGYETLTGESLDEVVTALCERSEELTAADLVVTQLANDMVDGFVLARQLSIADAIKTLMPVYYFDCVESEGKLKFVKRGGATVATIDENDLAAHKADSQQPDPLITVRRMEDELPDVFNFTYLLAASKYSIAIKTARRQFGYSGDEQALEVPIVMTDTKGQEVAEVNLHAPWVERIGYSFFLPRKYVYLEPTDPIAFDTRGYTMRLTKITQVSGGFFKCEAVNDDANVYTPHVVVTETPPPPSTIPPPASASGLILELMDVNMLDDAHNDAGIYAATCLTDPSATWPGAALYRSIDGGSTYQLLASMPNEATMGYVTNVLGNFYGGNIVDEINSINVVLSNGFLNSTTHAGLLTGVNTAVIGDEIVFFRDVTDEENGSYTLRGLLRGRRGTEYAMSTHLATDRFVLYEPTRVVRVAQLTSDIGLTRQFKPVPSGGVVSGATAQDFANLGTGLKPLAPVLLGGGRNAAGDVIAQWVRRNRIDGAWRDSVDVPNSEADESYEVEVWDSGYTTLKRTITGITSPTTTYTAAQQTTDFGSPQATVYLRVYQLSAIVGRGHACNGSI